MACGMLLTGLLTGCSGTPGGETIDKAAPKSASDSASYYFGMTMAGRMVQMGAQDSIYKDAKNRDAYWEGLRKGMSMLKEGDTPEARAYNEGLQMGMMLTNNFRQTTEEIPSFKFNLNMFEKGYGYAFATDSARGQEDAQFQLEKVMNAMQTSALAAKKAVLDKEIEAYAAKNGFKKNASGYYIKIVKQGNGPMMTQGDSLQYSMEFATSTGRDMKQYATPPTGVVLGKTLPMEYPGAKVLTTLKGGTVVKMLMTPDELFGQAAKSFHFDKNEFLILTVTPDYKGHTNFKPQAPAQPSLSASSASAPAAK